MLCNCCKKREAKIYYTEIINGEKKEQHLCEECAAEHTSFFMIDTLQSGFFIEGLLAGLLESFKAKSDEPACSECGMTLDTLFKTGRFGCAMCYESFEKNLPRLFRNLQGGDIHNGKIPKNYIKPEKADDKKSILTERDKLRFQLEQAIEKEEFEEAARLRDVIKELKEEETHGKMV